jgi:hypothetical protein
MPIEGELQAQWFNSTGLPNEQVYEGVEKISRELARWTESVRGAKQKTSIFDRSAYVAPDNPYSQMKVAKGAVTNDDVVSGVADVTEALAFQGVKWEASDPDDADVFNQMAADLNLDDIVRVWNREEFTYSQVIVATWWGTKTYKVRGYNVTEPALEEHTDPMTGAVSYRPPLDPETNRPVKPTKTKRRKAYDIWCPVAMTFLDPMKVLPMGSDPFGRDRLAWSATASEMAAWDKIENGLLIDPVMQTFFTGKVEATREVREYAAGYGFDATRLLWLNSDIVVRHTRTKPNYEPFTDVRLKSVFSLLDLKQQLIEADRVSLVGAANYILLVKKGTKDDPAAQPEIDNLKENFKVVAKLPVIVSDHRLEIEIIVPAQDFTLNGDKYDTLDRRILNRTLGSLSVTSSGQRNESTLTVARGVARTLETRRHMMKRTLERTLAKAVVEHPRNEGKFEGEPNMAFVPRNVQLDADSQIVQSVMSLRTQKELSRETTLEFFGFDQEVEAQRREFEEESGLDAIFGTQVPFAAPGAGGPPVAPQVSGAQGGRPIGGGKTPESPQKQAQPRTASGNSTRKKSE